MGGRAIVRIAMRLAITLGVLIAHTLLATPPDVIDVQSFDERGEFYSITLALDDTTSPGVYMTGNAVQAVYQAYAVKLDTAFELEWARTWGSTNHMFYGMWRGGIGSIVGYTTANPTHDYKVVEFNRNGTLHDSWDFGGNTTADRALGSCYFDDSHYLIAGLVNPGETTPTDGSLTYVTSAGDVEWSRIYSGSAGLRRVNRVAPNVIWLYGIADSVEGRGVDFWMARADSAGVLQDSFRWGGGRADELYDAERVDSALTILVGLTRSSPDSTQTDIWILATNDNGDSLWSGTFGGAENDAALCVLPVADRDSGFVIGGYWSEELLATRNALLMKFDQDFDSVWSILQYDTVIATEIRDVAVTPDFEYHAAGIFAEPIPHGYYLRTEVDPAAPLQHHPEPFGLLVPGEDAFFTVDTMRFRWDASSDVDPGDQIAYALLFDTDTLFDNPQVIGPLSLTTHLLNRNDDIFDRYWRVVAQDQHGNLTTCTDRHRHVRKIRPDSTQAFSLQSPDSGSALIMPSGQFSWQTAIDPDSLDEDVFYTIYFQVGDSISVIDTVISTSVIVDFAAHPFIEQSDTVQWWVVAHSGYPAMTRQSREVWTFINWNVPAGETPLVPRAFALHPAYPNPFNASVTLEYSLSEFTNIELSIYDITGRLVTTLVRGPSAPGNYSILWDGTANGAQLSTGLYLAHLISGGNVDTQKLLLLK